MNKKRIIIGTIVVFLLSTLFHFGYDVLPSFVTSILCPVNESIFEHNKMILTSFLVYTIFVYFLSKDGKSNTYMNFLATVFCILIVNITFTPIYLYVLKAQDNIVLTLIIYFISILLGFIISDKFVIEKTKKLESIATLGFLLLYVIFGIFTYYPPKLAIFSDFSGSFYGIK